MNKENLTIENEKKPEGNETPEIIKSPEELRQEIATKSEKEVDAFKKEGREELARFESGETTVDNEDKEALQGLNQDADKAQTELKSEIDEWANESPLPDGKKIWNSNSDFPPPLPKEERNLNRAVPPPIPKEKFEQSQIKESCAEETTEHDVEYYIQKSKITDKKEALRKLIEYFKINSEEELKSKLKEGDGDGDTIKILTPDNLGGKKNPSLSFLRKIKEGGNALGYTFFNTPRYESEIDDLIDKSLNEGETEYAHEVEKIFEEDRIKFEYDSKREREKSEFQEIDLKLLRLNNNDEEMKQYLDRQKNLPPDAIVHLYHGLKGGYENVLSVLNSPSHGIEQHSGPTLSLIPSGAFWKPGDLGFRYALRRNQIEFSGEKNPNAVVKIGDNDRTGIICNESKSLPLTQFEGEVMRSIETYPDFDAENKIKERLLQFSEIRSGLGKK
jgi:hypothetical protein